MRAVRPASARQRALGWRSRHAWYPPRDTPKVLYIVWMGNMAWLAVMNAKSETTSRRSEQTGLRPLPGYRAPDEGGEGCRALR